MQVLQIGQVQTPRSVCIGIGFSVRAAGMGSRLRGNDGLDGLRLFWMACACREYRKREVVWFGRVYTKLM